MPIKEHPAQGSIVICDFTSGFREPEMVKKRAVIVLSKKMKHRSGLCTIVPLSTTPPSPSMPFHCQLDITPALPVPLQSNGVWVKADMIYSVSFERLNFIRIGKDQSGKRLYYYNTLTYDQITRIQRCVLHGLSLSTLTKHVE